MYSLKELKELETQIETKIKELKKNLVEHSNKIIYLEGQLNKINDIRRML